MKRRNCRRTMDETKIHEKAVKLRKMTDEQLIYYVEDRVEKARSEGWNQTKADKIDFQEMVQEIGNLKGIGETKLREIKAILQKWLEEKQSV